MNAAELLELPITVDIETAGKAWGIGRTKAYAMAQAGTFPVPVLRLGHRYRVVTAELHKAFGITPERGSDAPRQESAAASLVPAHGNQTNKASIS